MSASVAVAAVLVVVLCVYLVLAILDPERFA